MYYIQINKNFVHHVGDQPRLYYDARSTNHQDFLYFIFPCHYHSISASCSPSSRNYFLSKRHVAKACKPSKNLLPSRYWKEQTDIYVEYLILPVVLKLTWAAWKPSEQFSAPSHCNQYSVTSRLLRLLPLILLLLPSPPH
jgi:hypothetical protein